MLGVDVPLNSNEAGGNEPLSNPDITLITNPPVANQERLRTGQLLADGRYKVLSYIGQGAMATVYKVEQVALKKQFALKLLSPYNEDDPRIRRFQKEAQAASQLDHPNLVRAIDFGMVEGNRPFLVMDFVAGKTLAQYLEEHGRLTLKETIDLFTPICAALSYAHQKGVIHRDVKPSNIMLVPVENEPGRFIPKVVDFGIAKIESDDESALTRTGEIFGTPLYMSPEQCSGKSVDKRSDIYALGCVIYQALVGTPPFVGDTAIAIISQHLNELPQSMSQASMGNRYSPALEACVAKALSKDPEARQSDCMQFATELIESPHTSVKQSAAVSEAKLKNNFGWIIAVVALAVISAAAYGIFEITSNNKQETKTQEKQSSSNDLVAPSETTESISPEHSLLIPEQTENRFSTMDNLERRFDFPPKSNLGDLYWWDHGKLFSVPATKTARVPVSAKVILDATGQIYELMPSLITRFRNEDLDGVRISANYSPYGIQALAYDDDKHEAAFKNLSLLTNLRILFFRGFRIPPRLVSIPHEITNVRWLVYDNCCKDTSQLSKSINLDKLRVLLVTDYAHPKKLIEKLSPNIRALGFPDCVLDQDDLVAINRLKSLNTLYLAQSGLTPDAITKLDKTLPRLKRLCVGIKAFGGSEEPPWFKYISNLDQFAIAGTKECSQEWRNHIRKRFPKCKVTFADDFSVEGRGWFDPRSFDPSGPDYGLSL
jgi:serine/threonine protein kinase